MKIFLFLSWIMILLATGCSKSTATDLMSALPREASRNDLTLIVKSDQLSVWAAESDKQAAQDVLAALQENTGQICASLQTECQFSVEVEIYPDQAGFDEHVMNPEMCGYFAISGPPHRIQMVSPANPAPHNISYEDGIGVAVHELVHLTLDEVNPDLPLWLDEGTAVYLGPHQLYTMACELAFPFELTPTFGQLEENYNSVQAPDLFAYAAVDYVVHEYGIEELNLLLRTPENLENILGVSRETFEENWQRFMRSQYHNNQIKEIHEP